MHNFSVRAKYPGALLKATKLLAAQNNSPLQFQRLPAPLSIYLDLVRFGAAMVVFLGHVASLRLTGGFLWQLGPYTTEAVTVFFVLSGFVIAYTTEQGETSARSYAVARAARIYSVALPALVLTFALDAIGRSIKPELYIASWGYMADNRMWQFVSGLFFVN
jgi:peptidoglycan/LPS O-acetylase OafA/YrhL